MKLSSRIGLAAVVAVTLSTAVAESQKSDLASSANAVAQKYLLVDTHIDVPYRLED